MRKEGGQERFSRSSRVNKNPSRETVSLLESENCVERKNPHNTQKLLCVFIFFKVYFY